jgi:cytochrome c peroxidase
MRVWNARYYRWALTLISAACTLVSHAAAEESPAALRELGKKIFLDASLSASGRMSCATCHSPTHAYGPPDGKAVQSGGLVRVRRTRQPGRDLVGIAIGHLCGTQQRRGGLLVQCVEARVP